MGTLISSGVAILDGLDITARTAGNKIVEMAVLKTRASISEGKTIAEPLRESGVFPPMVVQMIAVGEQTGALDAMLSKIADFYDEEVDTAVANLTSLLEPMLMVFLGIVIGGVVIAMYLPIFKLVRWSGSKALGRGIPWGPPERPPFSFSGDRWSQQKITTSAPRASTAMLGKLKWVVGVRLAPGVGRPGLCRRPRPARTPSVPNSAPVRPSDRHLRPLTGVRRVLAQPAVACFAGPSSS